jgi:hypothetical protein
MNSKPKLTQVFSVGADVQWKWMGRFIQGSVTDVYFEPVEKTIKTKKIKRNGSAKNPAYLVQSEAGNMALKLHSELQPREPKVSKAPRPKMFD